MKSRTENFFNKPWLPVQLKERINNYLEEDLCYAADEVVDLAEATLAFINALSIMVYIRQKNTDDRLNQEVVELLFGGHLNPGALYRSTVTGLLRKMKGTATGNTLSKRFMDETDNYRTDMNGLSELRNQIMHGLFVLPPDKNEENMEMICSLIEELFSDGQLNLKVVNKIPYHNDIDLRPIFYIDNKGHIRHHDVYSNGLENAIEVLVDSGDFFEIFNQTSKELSLDFLNDKPETISGEKTDNYILTDIQEKTIKFIKTGAGHLWITADQYNCQNISNSIKETLENNGYNISNWRAENTGLRYSQLLLLKVVAKMLGIAPKSNSLNGLENTISKCSKANKEKVVIIIDNAHKRQFSKDSFLQSVDFLYKQGIRIICLSPYYGTMFQYFNHHIAIRPKGIKRMSSLLRFNLFEDYLYDSGLLNNENTIEKQHLLHLSKAVDKLWAEVKETPYVTLRKMADGNEEFTSVLIEEAANLLSPVLIHDSIEFEPTQWDILLDNPKINSESSYIFQILGRTDINLDYKARICVHPDKVAEWLKIKKKTQKRYSDMIIS